MGLRVPGGREGGGREGGKEGRPRRTLVVEAVDPVDRGALVVAAQQEEVLGVLDFVGQQQADALQPVRSTVNVVAASQGEGGGALRPNVWRERARSIGRDEAGGRVNSPLPRELSGRVRPWVMVRLCLQRPRRGFTSLLR